MRFVCEVFPFVVRGYVMASLFLQRRRSVLVSGALLSLVNGMLYAWSAFTLPIENATGWSRSQTSLVFTFVLVFFGLGMLSGGYVIRKLGPRLAAACGAMALVLGLFLSSCAVAPWQLILSYGIMAGYGIGVANVVPSAVALCWYPEKRGLVCGIMACSLALGTLLFGTCVAGYLNSVAGYVLTLRVLALLALLIALPASVFLYYPEDGRRQIPGQGADGLNTCDMVRTPLFRKAWIWTCSVQIGGLMIIGHIVPYGVEQNISLELSGTAMGVYAAANGVGRLLFGMLFDARGSRFAMLADAGCMLCGLLLFVFLPPVAGYGGLLIASSCSALAFGGSIPLFSAFIARNFGPAHMESNIGTTATVFIIAGFAGPYLGGYVHDITGVYRPAILLAAFFVIPGLFSATLLHEKETPKEAGEDRT